MNTLRSMVKSFAVGNNLSFDIELNNQIKQLRELLNRDDLLDDDRESIQYQINTMERICETPEDMWSINYIDESWRVTKGGEVVSCFGYDSEWDAFDELKRFAPEETIEQIENILLGLK